MVMKLVVDRPTCTGAGEAEEAFGFPGIGWPGIAVRGRAPAIGESSVLESESESESESEFEDEDWDDDPMDDPDEDSEGDSDEDDWDSDEDEWESPDEGDWDDTWNSLPQRPNDRRPAGPRRGRHGSDRRHSGGALRWIE